MSGDSTNVTLWPDADVLLGPVTADSPDPGEPFALTGGDPWAFAGILDGDAGFAEDQSSDSNDFPGWGVGVIATSRRNLVVTRTFTALEDNKQTLAMRYNTAGVTFTGHNYSGTLAGRDLQAKFRFAFQTQSGDQLKRNITAAFAQIDSLGTVTEGENNIFSLPVTLKIYPLITTDDDTGLAIATYWETYRGPVVVPDP